MYLKAREFKRRDKDVCPLTMDSAFILFPFRFLSFLATKSDEKRKDGRNGKKERKDKTPLSAGSSRLKVEHAQAQLLSKSCLVWVGRPHKCKKKPSLMARYHNDLQTPVAYC